MRTSYWITNEFAQDANEYGVEETDKGLQTNLCIHSLVCLQ